MNRESFNNPMTFGGKDGPLGLAYIKKGTASAIEPSYKESHLPNNKA